MLKVLAFLLGLFTFLITAKNVGAAIEFTTSDPQTDGNLSTFNVAISGLTTSSCFEGKCYLQAAYTKEGSNRYFGFTKDNNSNWYKYNGSPGKDNIKSTFYSFQPQSGSWQGTLSIKIDPDDSDYKGPGQYTIKTWRYSGNSDTNSGDSETTLSVELTLPIKQDDSEASIPSVSNPSESTEIQPQKPTPQSKSSSKSSSAPSSKVLSVNKEASTDSNYPEAKQSTAESKTDISNDTADNVSQSEIASKKVASLFLVFGSVLIVASSVFFFYHKRKQNNQDASDSKV